MSISGILMRGSHIRRSIWGGKKTGNIVQTRKSSDICTEVEVVASYKLVQYRVGRRVLGRVRTPDEHISFWANVKQHRARLVLGWVTAWDISGTAGSIDLKIGVRLETNQPITPTWMVGDSATYIDNTIDILSVSRERLGRLTSKLLCDWRPIIQSSTCERLELGDSATYYRQRYRYIVGNVLSWTSLQFAALPQKRFPGLSRSRIQSLSESVLLAGVRVGVGIDK